MEFENSSMKANVVRNAFKLKDSIYLISSYRTKEKSIELKTLLKEKKELEEKDISEK